MAGENLLDNPNNVITDFGNTGEFSANSYASRQQDSEKNYGYDPELINTLAKNYQRMQQPDLSKATTQDWFPNAERSINVGTLGTPMGSIPLLAAGLPLIPFGIDEKAKASAMEKSKQQNEDFVKNLGYDYLELKNTADQKWFNTYTDDLLQPILNKYVKDFGIRGASMAKNSQEFKRAMAEISTAQKSYNEKFDIASEVLAKSDAQIQGIPQKKKDANGIEQKYAYFFSDEDRSKSLQFLGGILSPEKLKGMTPEQITDYMSELNKLDMRGVADIQMAAETYGHETVDNTLRPMFLRAYWQTEQGKQSPMDTDTQKAYLQLWLKDNTNIVNEHAKQIYGMIYDRYIKKDDYGNNIERKDKDGNVIGYELTEDGKKEVPDLNRQFLPAFNQFIKKDATYSLERMSQTSGLEWDKWNWEKSQSQKTPLVTPNTKVFSVNTPIGKYNVEWKNDITTSEGGKGYIPISALNNVNVFNTSNGRFEQADLGAANIIGYGYIQDPQGNTVSAARVQNDDGEYWIERTAVEQPIREWESGKIITQPIENSGITVNAMGAGYQTPEGTKPLAVGTKGQSQQNTQLKTVKYHQISKDGKKKKITYTDGTTEVINL